MAANACLPSTSLQYKPKANTLHRRYGQPVLALRFWKQWLEKEPMCSTEVIMEMTFTFVTSLVIWLPFSSQITSGGKKCNKWKFDKRTSLSPHFQLHCLCFQQPTVNPSVKILDGKFQKWAVLMFWIPCCTGQNDELCWPTLAYPIYESLFGPAYPPTGCYPHSDQQCGVGQRSVYAEFRATCSFRHPPEVLACMLCGRPWGGDVFCLIRGASFFILNRWI